MHLLYNKPLVNRYIKGKYTVIKDLKQFLNRIDLPRINPSSGALLVAEPFLRESYFNHAVIYLVDYGDGESSMGIVMNKTTNYLLSDLLNNVTRREPVPVYCGGPLSGDRLYFIHRLGDIIPGAKHIADGMYIGGDFDCMIDYVNAGYPLEGFVRFCLGYSGWDVGQLDDELKNNVWAVTSMKDADTILQGSEDGYWHGQVRTMGAKYRGWLYHPQYPSLN